MLQDICHGSCPIPSFWMMARLILHEDPVAELQGFEPTGVALQGLYLARESEAESLLVKPPSVPPHGMYCVVLKHGSPRLDREKVTEAASENDLGWR